MKTRIELSAVLLIAVYISAELIPNIPASKPVSVVGITVPAAVFIYALTFTLVDLVNERLGKQGALYVVYAAVAANLLLAGYVKLATVLPSASFYKGQEAFAAVLGSTPRIVAASLVAYFVSSLIDIEVFSWWRQRVGRHKWARVIASNAVSTLVDSAIFISIAFAGIFPLFPLIKGQYIVKMAVTVVSVPLIYLIRDRKHESGLTPTSGLSAVAANNGRHTE